MFDKAYNQVKQLVEDFKASESHFLSATYSEAEVRKDFIDKFFTILGWDVDHHFQKNPFQQEVKVEKGYYYRLRGYHSCTKNGVTENGGSSTNGIYIG